MGLLEDAQNPHVTLDEQASDPSTPSTGLWKVYAKSDGLYIIDDADNVTGPLAASTSAPTLASAKANVSSGAYTTTSSTFVDADATNLSLSITTGARRVLIGFTGTIKNDTSGKSAAIDVTLDGTRVGNDQGLLRIANTSGASAAFTFLTDVLSAGSHTFKIQIAAIGGGTTTLYATAGVSPAHFYVQEML